MEVGRHHAADLVSAPVEDQRAAGDPAIAAELAAPERVGEHGRPRTAGDVLALRRTAPEGRLDLQRGEKAGGDPRDADLHRRPSPRQRLPGRAHAGDGCEDAALAGHVDIVRPRKRPARIGPGRTLVQPHQLLGMRQPERPQDHAADHAENRCASTHPDGEHQHCRRGEARRAPEGPQREAEVIHAYTERKPDAICATPKSRQLPRAVCDCGILCPKCAHPILWSSTSTSSRSGCSRRTTHKDHRTAFFTAASGPPGSPS